MQTTNKNVFGDGVKQIAKNTPTNTKNLQLNSSDYALECFIKKYKKNPTSIIAFCEAFNKVGEFNRLNFPISGDPNRETPIFTFFGSIDITHRVIDTVNNPSPELGVCQLITIDYAVPTSVNYQYTTYHQAIIKHNQPFQTFFTRVENCFAHFLISPEDADILNIVNFNGFLLQH